MSDWEKDCEVIQDEHDKEFQIIKKERWRKNGNLQNWRDDEFKLLC